MTNSRAQPKVPDWWKERMRDLYADHPVTKVCSRCGKPRHLSAFDGTNKGCRRCLEKDRGYKLSSALRKEAAAAAPGAATAT